MFATLHTFSCVQISPSPAPIPCLHTAIPACRLLAGRRLGAAESSPPPSCRAGNCLLCQCSKTCAHGQASPQIPAWEIVSCVIRMGIISCCSPDASLCVSGWMGQREEDKNNCNVLFERGCLQRLEWGGRGDVPLSLSRTGDSGHSKCMPDPLRKIWFSVFWIDTGFRDIENKSCWHAGALGSLGEYLESSWI